MIEKPPSSITITFPCSQNHVKGTVFVCPNCGRETGLKAAAESHGVMKDLRRTAELRNAWNRLVGQAKDTNYPKIGGFCYFCFLVGNGKMNETLLL